jgi:hypothetical protein
MADEGNIAGLDLIDKLIELGRKKFTGAMRFENEGIIKIIYFKDGDVLSASTNDRTDSIDEILFRAGKITRDHIKQALAKRKENETLGDALLNLGFIARKELTWARRVQVIGIIRSIVSWPGGSYTVVPDYLPKREEGTLFPLVQILLELIVTDPDRAKFELALESGNAVFQKTDGFEAAFRPLGLNQDADDIVAQIDGLRSAGEVASRSGKDVFNVFKLLYALERLGLLRRSTIGSPRIADDLNFDDVAPAAASSAATSFTGFSEPPTASQPEQDWNAPAWDRVADATEPIELAENAPALLPGVESRPIGKDWDGTPAGWAADEPAVPATDRDFTPIGTIDPSEVRSQVRENLGHDEGPPAERRSRSIFPLLIVLLGLGIGFYAAWWWLRRETPAPVAPMAASRPRPRPIAPSTSSVANPAITTPSSSTRSSPSLSSTSPSSTTSTMSTRSTQPSAPKSAAAASETASTKPPAVASAAPASHSTSTKAPTRSAPKRARTSPPSGPAEPRVVQPSGSRPLVITNIPPGSKAAGIEMSSKSSRKAAAPASPNRPAASASVPAASPSADPVRARYDEMARQNKQNVAASAPYTVQFELVCQTDSITKALRAGGNNVWFVPTTFHGQACFRVFWGRYGTRQAAEAAMSVIPVELRAGSKPGVVRADR